MATKFGSTTLTSYDSYSGLTMTVNFEAYYEGNNWYGRIASIAIHSESGGAYGWTCYLNGSFYVNGKLVGSSAFAGEHSCYIGNQTSTFYFSNFPKDTATMSMGTCSARSVTVSFNAYVDSASGSSFWADETSFSGSGTMSLSAVSHNSTNGGTASVHTKCSRCGATISTSHSYTTKVTTAATCTTAGVQTHSCSCGYSYTSSIAATGHTSVYGGTSGVHTKCSACGTTLSSTHSYTSSVQTAATCTTKGTTKYTCDCGYSYTSQDIPALGHAYSSTTNADGSVTYTCITCGSSYTVAAKKSGIYTAHIYSNGGTKKYKPYIFKDSSWKLRQTHIFKNPSGS